MNLERGHQTDVPTNTVPWFKKNNSQPLQVAKEEPERIGVMLGLAPSQVS